VRADEEDVLRRNLLSGDIFLVELVDQDRLTRCAMSSRIARTRSSRSFFGSGSCQLT
jgi:hypothetical protein